MLKISKIVDVSRYFARRPPFRETQDDAELFQAAYVPGFSTEQFASAAAKLQNSASFGVTLSPEAVSSAAAKFRQLG